NSPNLKYFVIIINNIFKIKIIINLLTDAVDRVIL
ncbi:MAG: hypothetical protein K0R90_1627, partial [Oscillospiraceae bacterium]|nr:hypothetical protein [Oscillospiraceae bacterium]